MSAMQKDPEQKIDAPFEVEETLAFSPVNLGDLPNVLVATACENCKEGEASLWKDAFYGQKFVQIAAPSMSIAAPINESGVALAGEPPRLPQWSAPWRGRCLIAIQKSLRKGVV